jgi:hypothetical protein
LLDSNKIFPKFDQSDQYYSALFGADKDMLGGSNGLLAS